MQKFVKTNINNFLPIGLQIICNKNDDEKALEIALALEKQFGEPELPDINNFL
jgi:Asp-tRNA(Asn)/Glu-tRNA(Gln) amidotransferase A subunit family amidase